MKHNRNAGVENAKLEKGGQKMQGRKMRDWNIRENERLC